MHNGPGFEECMCGNRVPEPLDPQQLVDYVDTGLAMRNLSQWDGQVGALARAAIAADPEKWKVRKPRGDAKRSRLAAKAAKPKATTTKKPAAQRKRAAGALVMHEHTHLTRSNGIVRFCEGGEGRQGCLACPNGMIDFNKPGKWDTRDLRSAQEFFSAELESSGQGGAARESPPPCTARRKRAHLLHQLRLGDNA